MEPEDELEQRFFRAQAALERGNWPGARRDFEILVLDAPGFAPAWDGLGRCHAAEDNLPQAEECFRRAVRADRGSWAARYHWGQALQAAGRVRDAARLYREALRIAPEERCLHYAMGQVYLELGEPREALFSLRAALEKRERGVSDAEVYIAIGGAEAERGDLQAADEAFQQACLLEPNNPRVLLKWATLSLRAGDLPGAERLARRAEALDHRSFRPRTLLAALAWERRDWAAADAAITGVEAMPQGARLAAALEAETARRRGDPERAREKALEVLRLEGSAEDGAVSRALATLRALREPAEGLQGFRLVLEVDWGTQVYYRRFVALAPDEPSAAWYAAEVQDSLDGAPWRVAEIESFDHEDPAAPGIYELSLGRALFPKPPA